MEEGFDLISLWSVTQAIQMFRGKRGNEQRTTKHALRCLILVFLIALFALSHSVFLYSRLSFIYCIVFLSCLDYSWDVISIYFLWYKVKLKIPCDISSLENADFNVNSLDLYFSVIMDIWLAPPAVPNWKISALHVLFLLVTVAAEQWRLFLNPFSSHAKMPNMDAPKL